MRQNLVHGCGARRNGHHHVLETFLNALGNFNLALSGQKFYGTHLPHVHPNGIGGATKV